MRAFEEIGFAAAVVVAFLVTIAAARALQPLAGIPFFLWLIFFCLDAAATERIYQLSPTFFRQRETNKILVVLTQKMGISAALLACFFLVEVPVFALIAFVIAPAFCALFFSEAALIPCLSAGAAVLALAHAHGWVETAAVSKLLADRRGKKRVTEALSCR